MCYWMYLRPLLPHFIIHILVLPAYLSVFAFKSTWVSICGVSILRIAIGWGLLGICKEMASDIYNEGYQRHMKKCLAALAYLLILFIRLIMIMIS